MNIYDPRYMFRNAYFLANGHDATVSCPNSIHSKNNKNAVYNYLTYEFICHSCKKQFGKNSLQELLNWIRAFYPELLLVEIGLEEIQKIKSQMELDWRYLATQPLAHDHPYLAKRKIDNSTVDKFGIVSADNKVAFPLYDWDTNLVGYQVRHLKGKIKYQHFGAKTPFGFQFWSQYKPDLLVLTEGVFGALRGYQAGYQTMAVLGAGGIKDCNVLAKFWEVVLCFDNDEAGYNLAAKMKRRCKNIDFSFCIPGEFDEMDPDEWKKRIDTRRPLMYNYLEKVYGKEHYLDYWLE